MTDTTVIRTVTCTLLDPTASGRALPGVTWAPKIQVQLTWHPDNPPSIQIKLMPKAALAQWLPETIVARACWIVDLELLATGLDAPVGEVDVMVAPAYRRDLTEIILASGSDQIGLRIRRALLADFVAASRSSLSGVSST